MNAKTRKKLRNRKYGLAIHRRTRRRGHHSSMPDSSIARGAVNSSSRVRLGTWDTTTGTPASTPAQSMRTATALPRTAATPHGGGRYGCAAKPRPQARSQRNEMRVGDQYVSITGPIRLSRGTVPHTRESQELMRLSPRTK